jgi:Holliday junction resolvase-like predicted endonuclease
MEIKRKYLQKYLHSIASEQIAAEYREKGYIVSTEERIGKYEADIIARQEKETIVIEIKVGRLTPQKKESIAGIADYVKAQSNYKFLVVVATPPKEKKLEMSGIEQILSDYFLNEMPDELDQLSTHTRLEDVSDVEIDEILIDGKEISVKGSGVFNIEIQFSSDSDQHNDLGHKSNDTIPFDFDIVIELNRDGELEIIEVNNLIVDTSSYYGEE